MARVKGSPKKRIKVVEYRLRAVLSIVLLSLVIIVASVSGAYFFAYKLGMSGQEKASQDVSRLSTELSDWREKANEYEQLLENSKTAAEIDRQSSEGVRQEVIALKDEIARLSEENSFYRGLMAPNEKSSGLTIGAVELVRARDSANYVFKIVIQQLAKRHNVLSGSVTVSVNGKQDGIDKSYPLIALSEDVSAEQIKLRFKYFQVLEGELALPDNFEPEGLEINASTSGAKPQKVSKKFGWLVEEI